MCAGRLGILCRTPALSHHLLTVLLAVDLIVAKMSEAEVRSEVY